MNPPGAAKANTAPPPPSASRRRNKWIVLAGCAIALLFLGRCGRSAYHSYQIADRAAQGFHQQLNNGEYEDVYGEASEGYRIAGTRQEQDRILQNDS
jgi:hypothetical protein